VSAPVYGQRNGMARDSDAVVRLAKDMRASGQSLRRIAQALTTHGRPISFQTVRQWVNGTTRASA
jgi:hypothetical protein